MERFPLLGERARVRAVLVLTVWENLHQRCFVVEFLLSAFRFLLCAPNLSFASQSAIRQRCREISLAKSRIDLPNPPPRNGRAATLPLPGERAGVRGNFVRLRGGQVHGEMQTRC